MKKLLKKAFLFLMVVSLIVAALPFFASATSGTTYLIVSNSTPAFGDIITIKAVFNLSDNALGIMATLRYSKNYLEYVSGNDANMVTDGEVYMVKVGDSKTYSVTMQFKVIGVGNAEVILRDCYFADSNNEYLATGSSFVLPTKKAANTNVAEAPTLSYFTVNSVVLKRQEGCEYSIDGVNWQESTYFGNLKSGQEYSFYQRLKETSYFYPGQNSQACTVVTGNATNEVNGDVNQDGLTDAADLSLLKKIIAYINDSYDKTLIDPDVDKSNGMPNAADLALLKKIIAKLA